MFQCVIINKTSCFPEQRWDVQQNKCLRSYNIMKVYSIIRKNTIILFVFNSLWLLKFQRESIFYSRI